MEAHTNHTNLSSQITRLLVHTGWSTPGNFQARQPDHKEPFISAFVLSTEHTFLPFRIVIHLQIYKSILPLKIIGQKIREQMLPLSHCSRGRRYSKCLCISYHKFQLSSLLLPGQERCMCPLFCEI